MTAQQHEGFDQHVRRYLYVFYALLFGTLITVGASYIPFGNHAFNALIRSYQVKSTCNGVTDT